MEIKRFFSKTKQKNGQTQPTVFHITHYKAGSQWVYAILREVVGDRIIAPLPGAEHVTKHPISRGKIYPCVYLPKEQFESLDLPGEYRNFIVIRDLRDTLISHYFSMVYSHPILKSRMQKARERLKHMSVQEGLLDIIRRRWIPAEIQRTWAHNDSLVIRYEDLNANEYEIFQKIMTACDIGFTSSALKAAVEAHSFEKKAGRKKGQEDIGSHHRKGIVGDWRNYFDETVTAAFKERFGDVLIETGYEKDYNWGPE
jgi:lipopolysaccharide transport system ATP-binding protein